MDFNLKHWRDSSSSNSEEKQETSSGPPPLKQPKLHLHSSELPLFVPPAATDQHPTATKFPRMGSYFNLGQWQELELQALIFRHMISGVSVPHELLHLVQKSIITSSSPLPLPPPPYYLSHSLQQYYPPHYQPNLMQSGYWGKGAMDPEPGRCRRTDGKKWRCSRDVVAGQKYCERHVHRGRNRSRKPVETPTSTTTTTTPYGGGAGETLKAITTTQRMTAGGGGGDIPHFTLSGPSSSVDLLHLSRRPPSDSMIEPFKVQNDTQLGDGRTLRPFFDDWPRSLHESDNNINSVTSATNLSISMPGNHPTSDFSLKLGTGHEDEPRAQIMRGESERPQLNWGTNLVAPMGGPLAEALRSSTPRSSPTSVLHRLSRGSAYDASYVST